MAYTITIDLDYDSHPEQELREVWRGLCAALMEAGFHRDGRRFTSNRAASQAQRRARQAVDRLEHALQVRGRSVFPYIRNFYGYPTDCTQNLLLPPANSIEVHSEISHPAPSAAVYQVHRAGAASTG